MTKRLVVGAAALSLFCLSDALAAGGNKVVPSSTAAGVAAGRRVNIGNNGSIDQRAAGCPQTCPRPPVAGTTIVGTARPSAAPARQGRPIRAHDAG
jgi:hypothetical protein